MSGTAHSSTRRRLDRRFAAPGVALTLALGLVACGDSGEGEDEDAAAPPTTTTIAEDHGGAEGETIAVRGVDYRFEGLPASVDAGTELTFSNDSAGEVHELVLFRLPDDEDRPLQELLALPREEVGMVTGPPVGVSVALPGEDGMVVEGDLTLHDGGRYVAVCALPIGGDPQAYRDALSSPTPPDGPLDIPGGPPHFTAGMAAELTVE